MLTHDDVITLFHETGHALHALLSEVDEPGAAAFSSVEWDAIELPSQFMENFCWEWAVVQKLSAHADTGETLPRALYDRMIAARNYQSGMQTVRQIEFALFDMLMHDRAQGISIAQVLALLQEVRQEVAVLFPPAWHRLPHAFAPVRRRLWRRLLQLQVGRGAVGRRLRGLRGSRRPPAVRLGAGHAGPGDRRALPPRSAGRGRFASGGGILRRLPWPRAAY